MKRIIFAFLFSIVGVSFALSQTPVLTQPGGTTSNHASSTIAVTDTFQSVFIASTSDRGRLGCVVQNNSVANSMFVFFGPIANATKGDSVKLSIGQSVNCETVGGSTIKDQVSITGTSGDAFYAAQY